MAVTTVKKEKSVSCTRLLALLSYLLPPLIVAASLLVYFCANGYYPFGSVTISWCDMDQQYVPLLLDFKDILEGKDGLFLNFQNAAGMNFYGVFFFFLASPFSFLVLFVERSAVMGFANVIVGLKMCTIALTAFCYLRRRHPNALLVNTSLSVLYAFSGYVMMYFQNCMWLDIAALFPLLLIGLERLKTGQCGAFVAVLAACVVVNFYLSYMLVMFLLLYAFFYLVLEKDRAFAVRFCLSCALAALLSAIVWLPCLIQYLLSGRTTSVVESLIRSSLLTHFQTALPTVFSVLFLFPFAFSRGARTSSDGKLRFILFCLTLVPVVFEPINKMWQTGNYMSFPTRYAFITIFLCLTLAADGLTCAPEGEGETQKTDGWRAKRVPKYALSAVLVLLSVVYFIVALRYTSANHEAMDQYSHSLWGNDESFRALAELYAGALLVGVVVYLFYRFNLCKPVCLWLAVAVMTASELYVAPMTYMHAGSHDTDWHLHAMELSQAIDDDEFYRVKTEKEYSWHDFDANLMGAIGYNALGHYTSLTSEKYMTAIKQFGYTSYWMEVGNSGGTKLTDALLSVKYVLSDVQKANDLYRGEYYALRATSCALPLGIVAKGDIAKRAAPPKDLYARAEFQKMLCEDFFADESIVTTYDPLSAEAELHDLTVEKTEEGYALTPSASDAYFRLTLSVTGERALYFQTFDENSNALSHEMNSCFSIGAPKRALAYYPTQKLNGWVDLGSYENERVTITIGVSKALVVRDIGLCAIDTEKLERKVAETSAIGLTEIRNGLVGEYTASGGECVFLSVPYDRGMRITINGKNTEVYEVYGGFTAFYLQSGENDIRVTFVPVGFTTGCVLTVIGVGLCAAACVLFVWKKRTIALPNVVGKASYGLLQGVGAAVLVLLYLLPLVLCLL